MNALMQAILAWWRSVRTPAAKPIRICVDPGHGGRDPGAGRKWPEADVALQIGRLVAQEAERRGHTVILTRDADVDLGGTARNWKAADLAKRCAIANDFRADAFVSIHANSAAAGAANGAWTLHAAGSIRGAALAQSIFDHLAMLHGIVDADPAPEVYPDGSAWVNYRPLYVLRKTRAPAVIVETGFLTNLDDERDLTDPGVQALIAKTIVDGIDGWADSSRSV